MRAKLKGKRSLLKLYCLTTAQQTIHFPINWKRETRLSRDPNLGKVVLYH